MSTKLHIKQDQLKDPVCNMVVSIDSKFHSHHKDNDYYFCSNHCQQKFNEHPEQYLDQQPLVPHEAHGKSISYICPMHPEIQQQGPGNCMK